MGQRRAKRERFFAENPVCCFCGGEEPTTTVDHVPNRASFPYREGPEGYEFPACDVCQKETRLDEIAFSCMVHFNNHDPHLFDERGFARLIDGLRNNLPHMNSFDNLTPNQKRRALSDLGIERPAGTPLSEVAIVTVHPEFGIRTRRYLWKLARALFYKHVGRSAKSSSIAWSAWFQGKATNHQAHLETWQSITPILIHGTRRNFDYGNRFKYRINYSDELEVFAATGQFGDGLIFNVLLVNEEMAARLKWDAFVAGAERPLANAP